MDCCNNRHLVFTRRAALQAISCGFGYMAFSGMADAQGAKAARGASGPLAAKSPHFTPGAKRVIFLSMSGGPSHVDTFDYKEALNQMDGQSYEARGRGRARLLGSPWKFTRQGKSGLYVSELLPAIGSHADEMCLLRGMHTDVPAHPQATIQMHTGSFQFVRPSMGAWTVYGLGTVNQNLPGFVTLSPGNGNGGVQNYGAAFLPAVYQGSAVNLSGGGAGGRRGRGGSESMPNIARSTWTDAGQREQMEFVQKLNQEKLRREARSDAIEGVIESYELAFRMQAEVPDVMDTSNETPETLALYGIGEQETNAFGRQCLLARRFAEAGVRFVEISHGGWDTHRNLRNDMVRQCGQIDRPIAGLLTDLKRRGMLKDTLVIWGGEFGRTPYAQDGDGRDHNHRGFTMWMAGGGVKGGYSYGSTDEVGYEAVDGKMHVHDWHATVLHLLGMDHTKLTYNHAGRDFRLTEVYGTVATDIVA